MTKHKLKKGKVQPILARYSEKKEQAVEITEVYKYLAKHSKDKHIQKRRYTHKAQIIEDCGSVLKFFKTGEQSKKLIFANFCKQRLCPMCTWRKSQKMFHQVSSIMDYLLAEDNNLVPIFLTLTIKNCSGKALPHRLDDMFSGWKKMLDKRGFKRVVVGWFRALEVTYNSEENTYHPHFHAIILVDKDYFKSNDYISQKEWVKMWRESVQLNYNPVVDVRKIDSDPEGKGVPGIVAEASKYSVKSSDILTGKTMAQKARVLAVLDDALFNRRLSAFGGKMRKAKLFLGLGAVETGELTDETEYKLVLDDAGKETIMDGTGTLRPDLAEAIVTYAWRMGAYVQVANDEEQFDCKLSEKPPFASKEKLEQRIEEGKVILAEKKKREEEERLKRRRE